MIKELYKYAYPNYTDDNKNPFKMTLLLVLTASFYLISFCLKSNLGFITTNLYLVLSLLNWIDKDIVSRYMKLVCLFVIAFSVIGIHACLKMIPFFNVVLALVLGTVAFVVYEIVFFIKIKNRIYSNPRKSKAIIVTVSSSSITMSIFIITSLLKNPSTKFLAGTFMSMLFAVVIYADFVGIQKYVIYLYARNKIYD